MHKTIIFILKQTIDISPFVTFSHLIIQNDWEIIDENSLKHQNKIIYFDYIITDEIRISEYLNLEKEDEKLITNYFLQTSMENIYAIGDANSCLASVSDQLYRIYEDITTK